MKKSTLSTGFTLTEVLIVMAIIAILASISVAGFNLVSDKQKFATADAQIRMLSGAIDDYQIDNGSYPEVSDEFSSSKELFLILTNSTKDESGEIMLGDQSYADFLDPNNAKKDFVKDGQILDPWGSPYFYLDAENHGTKNPDFDLWSIGKDKEAGTSDDIVNW